MVMTTIEINKQKLFFLCTINAVLQFIMVLKNLNLVEISMLESKNWQGILNLNILLCDVIKTTV